jgi:hypothetical protein
MKDLIGIRDISKRFITSKQKVLFAQKFADNFSSSVQKIK